MEVVSSCDQLWPELDTVGHSHVLLVPTGQGANVYPEASSLEEEGGLINAWPQSNCRSPQYTAAYSIKVCIGMCVWHDQFSTDVVMIPLVVFF